MKTLLLVLLLTCALSASAQLSNEASALATGNALVGAWETSGDATNFSSLVNSKNTFIETSAFNRYSLKELTTLQASFAGRINSNNCLWISISKLNDNSFSEQTFVAGIAKRLSQKFCAGVKLEYKQWLLEDLKYTDSHALIPEASFVVSALPDISLGVVVSNPVRTGMNKAEEKPLSAVILTGVSAKISSKLTFGIAAQSTGDQSVSYNAGMEYRYAQYLMLRVGYKSYPVSQSFGFQLSISKYDLALAMETNPQLGLSSAVSIIFNL
jgi:hypothetical protein